MANNNIPDELGFDFVTHVNPIVGIPDNVVPTSVQVCRELRRFHRIQQVYVNGGNVTNAQYSAAAIRHHRVIQARSGVVVGNQAAIQGIQDTLNVIVGRLDGIDGRLNGIDGRLNGIDGRLDGIDGRLDRIDARSAVSNARFTNWQRVNPIVGLHWKTVQFVSIVKHTVGHPFLPQPNVDGVQLAADYPLGSQPPAGLMPANNDEIDRWSSHMTLEQLREKYRGIFWFYNDPRFQLPVNAPLDLILDANITLANFYRYE